MKEETPKEEAGQERLVHLLANGIKQFLFSQTQGLKRFFELQDQLPIRPKLFDP